MFCTTYLITFFSPSSVPHTRSLEARIKEELVAQGLLDSEERPGPGGDSEDEVLAELQKRQAELKALSAHNRARKQELLRWGYRATTILFTMIWTVLYIRSDPWSAVDINFLFAAASQTGKRGDAQTGAEAESQGVWQRGDGGISTNHGSQAEETHSDQEGERSGLESTEGEGKHPQAAGWIEEDTVKDSNQKEDWDRLEQLWQLLHSQWTALSMTVYDTVYCRCVCVCVCVWFHYGHLCGSFYVMYSRELIWSVTFSMHQRLFLLFVQLFSCQLNFYVDLYFVYYCDVMKTVHMNVQINQNDLKTQDFLCVWRTQLSCNNFFFSAGLVSSIRNNIWKHRLVQLISISCVAVFILQTFQTEGSRPSVSEVVNVVVMALKG